jgi:polysaccharide export outer membrane protein
MFLKPDRLTRLAILLLANLYTVGTILPLTLVLWIFRADAAAYGQTLPPDSLNLSEPPHSTNPPIQIPLTQRQRLEDARDQLIDREQTNGEAETDRPSWPVLIRPGQITSSQEQFTTYRLGAGDSIFVNVLRFSDLSFQGTLDAEGNLLVPLVGALKLQGLTIDQARERLRVAFDRYVINPQVDVILIAQRPVQVTVLGEVVQPGLYPLAAPDLATAILSAGGATGLADLRIVHVRRHLPDGSIAEQDFDLFTPLRDALSIPDIPLADGDTVVIPTLTEEAREDYDRSLVARSTLAQRQINVRFLNYASGTGGSVGNIVLNNGSNFVDAIAVISPSLGEAEIGSIALIRFDVQQGKAITQELNGKQAFMGDTSQNPMLENNDVIVIGRNLITRITYFFNTFTQPFRDVLGFLLFFDSLSNAASDLFRPTGNSQSNN